MKRYDLLFLFLFLIIFSCSTLILVGSVHDSPFFMATSLKVLETGISSIDIGEALETLAYDVERKRVEMFDHIKNIEWDPLLWLRGRGTLKDERERGEALPLVDLQGLEEIYVKKSDSISSHGVEREGEGLPKTQERPILPQEDPKERIETLSPEILIIHSHTAETYKDDPLDIGTGHVSPGERGLITEVGRELASTLEQVYGVNVYHEQRVHDQRYSLSYLKSRETLKGFLQKNPETGMVLDIHRDAMGISAPNEITKTFYGEKVARLLIIVGSDELGLSHPTWRQNLQFAHLLGERIELMYPGLLRRIEVRDNRLFNQDLHPKSILLEVGDYRNTTEEALRTASLLASVLHSLLEDL